ANEMQWVESPDIVIVEGVNVLQVRPRPLGSPEPSIFVSDFFDFSIFVDAEDKDLEQWYIERFKSLRTTAFANPESYFHRYAHLTDAESEEIARKIWNEINKPNLVQNILPTRFRASLILEKGNHHFVQSLKLRKT
ncbi:MAG: pantothenate kinase, partial [Bacteroidetes bacterium]|nr:pantothenate kinase [Bacteroidota bacterium]